MSAEERPYGPGMFALNRYCCQPDNNIKKMIKNVKKEVRNFKEIREQFPFMSDVYVKENALRDTNYVSTLKKQIKKLMKFPLTYFIRKKKKQNDKYNIDLSSEDSSEDENFIEDINEENYEEDDGINIVENQIEGENSFGKKKPWLPFIPSKYLYEAGDEKTSKNSVNKITSYLSKEMDFGDDEINEAENYKEKQYDNMKNNPRNFVYMLFCDLRLNQKMAYLQKALEFNLEKNEPQPLPKLEGDEVTFIGSTFMKFGESEPYLNHCVVKDSCSNYSKDEKTEIVECGGDEKEVLREWLSLIHI